MDDNSTHFGYQKVDETEKAKLVANVFDSVATRYDMMNDIMSGGLHRLWKLFTISRCDIREGSKILDIASGTGDLARAFAKRTGKTGEVWLTDINNSMLTIGRDRLVDSGYIMPACQCDAEKLPFPDNYFDLVSVAFGLRNMTHKDTALAEMHRVIKPGGRVAVLDFSQICKPLAPLYDFYSFNIIPKIGRFFVKDETSYRYLVESIRVHPDQETLRDLMENAGLARVEYYNLTFGVVALHIGYKL